MILRKTSRFFIWIVMLFQ